MTAISFAHECDPDTYGLFAVGGTNGVVSVYDFDEVSKAIKQSLSELFFSFSVYDFQFVSNKISVNPPRAFYHKTSNF